MASGKIRSTRRLRSWMVEQVSSGKYPGLIWDNDAKTMFRIPWKHGGKQDFRSEVDGAIFKAWAVFKGKLSEGGRADPASWKTRLRVALNKSPEFREEPERSQLEISEPYKVYRLVPINEQALGSVDIKARAGGRKRRSRDSDIEEEEEEVVKVKQMKEVTTSLPFTMEIEESVLTVQLDQVDQPSDILKSPRTVNEIQVNFTIETVPPPGAQDSFHVLVKYMGEVVLKRGVMGSDVRIAYLPSSPVPPTPMVSGFPRIPLPDPPSTLTSSPGIGPQFQALSTLLPFLEKGVILTTTGIGVYAKRYCQGQVFWTGPHSATAGPHKMNHAVEPVRLFDREAFRMELDHFRRYGGDPPQCGFTLYFSDTEDPSSKLIIIQITLPWAQQQVKEAEDFQESMTYLRNITSESGDVTINLVPGSLLSELLGTSLP
ncbi:interferon regulatory factor 9 isoform X1 [Coregonus clupeaformis]|uniref:interferon regulatory factor 9 isoform X1 n=1 Tax=Coregonus clupeaformis TaxID=59861 RepID=UPI001BE03634|nr:interferon regulatory factor 9 isoform X1 [Coregonus clupeaformis]